MIRIGRKCVGAIMGIRDLDIRNRHIAGVGNLIGVLDDIVDAGR